MGQRKLLIAGVILLGLICAAIGVRIYAGRELQHRMLHARPQSTRTPAEYGAPYEELQFQSGDRALKAFYVAPPAAEKKSAVLIFHGNDESIASWSPVQGYLYQHGLGSMVFDYSGFGHSEGTATIDHALADGVAAWNEFKAKLPANTRACGYGLSLGSGVLLEDAAKFAAPPDCLVIYGAYTSALGAGVRTHVLPAFCAPLLPDALESVKNAAHLPAPLLVLHGDHDEKFPVEDGRAVAEAAHAEFIVLPGFTHAQPLIKPDDAGWRDAMAFVRAP